MKKKKKGALTIFESHTKYHSRLRHAFFFLRKKSLKSNFQILFISTNNKDIVRFIVKNSRRIHHFRSL
jgi:hypothetical protein